MKGFAAQEIKKDNLCQHYKGRNYSLIGLAHHSETLEEMVVYQGLYDSPEFGKQPIWVRPKKDFFGKVEIDGKKVQRFKLIKQ